MAEREVRLGYDLSEPPGFALAIAPAPEAERIVELVQTAETEGFMHAFATTEEINPGHVGSIQAAQINFIFHDSMSGDTETEQDRIQRYINERLREDLARAERMLGMLSIGGEVIVVNNAIYVGKLFYRTLFDPHLSVPIKSTIVGEHFANIE